MPVVESEKLGSWAEVFVASPMAGASTSEPAWAALHRAFAARDTGASSSSQWTKIIDVYSDVDKLIEQDIQGRGKLFGHLRRVALYRCAGARYNETLAAMPPPPKGHELRLPRNARVLWYGNSWMNQIYLEALRFNAAMSTPTFSMHLPVERSDNFKLNWPCRSGTISAPGIAPYSTVHFEALNTTVVPISNCYSLQHSSMNASLAEFLHAQAFTHAAVSRHDVSGVTHRVCPARSHAFLQC